MDGKKEIVDTYFATKKARIEASKNKVKNQKDML